MGRRKVKVSPKRKSRGAAKAASIGRLRISRVSGRVSCVVHRGLSIRERISTAIDQCSPSELLETYLEVFVKIKRCDILKIQKFERMLSFHCQQKRTIRKRYFIFEIYREKRGCYSVRPLTKHNTYSYDFLRSNT